MGKWSQTFGPHCIFKCFKMFKVVSWWSSQDTKILCTSHVFLRLVIYKGGLLSHQNILWNGVFLIISFYTLLTICVLW